MAVVSNSRSKPLIASSFRQYPRLLDVSLRKERAEERERERELRQDLECVKENRMKRSVCTYIHLRPDESRFTREFSVFLLIKAFYLLNGSFRWRC